MTASAEQQAAVKLSEAAAGQIREMQASQPENTGKILRVYVEGGGCSGMQYGMVFDEKRDNDELAESFGVPVLVDSVSAGHLRGALIDYSDALTGGGFKITNPHAKSSCGCGKSFEA
jgi:iron-sulfur cluster assembly protein/iron-sulfur cluster insertion protein